MVSSQREHIWWRPMLPHEMKTCIQCTYKHRHAQIHTYIIISSESSQERNDEVILGLRVILGTIPMEEWGEDSGQRWRLSCDGLCQGLLELWSYDDPDRLSWLVSLMKIRGLDICIYRPLGMGCLRVSATVSGWREEFPFDWVQFLGISSAVSWGNDNLGLEGVFSNAHSIYYRVFGGQVAGNLSLSAKVRKSLYKRVIISDSGWKWNEHCEIEPSERMPASKVCNNVSISGQWAEEDE